MPKTQQNVNYFLLLQLICILMEENKLYGWKTNIYA